MKVLNCLRLTTLKWLNMYRAEYLTKDDQKHSWLFVSRKKNPLEDKSADAVVIVPFVGKDHIVLIRQFRIPVNGYVYELPAGIIDEGEDAFSAACREIKEETGMEIVDPILTQDGSRGFYNSAGLTDESVSFVFAKVEGEPTTKDNEGTEEIEVLVLDREQVAKMLYDNINFSAKCWLILKAFADGYDWIGE